MKSNPNHAYADQTESERIYNRANNLGYFAWFVFIVGIIMGFAAVVKIASGEPGDGAYFWAWVGGSVISSALVFFFFSQLLHIRAALYSINEAVLEQHKNK